MRAFSSLRRFVSNTKGNIAILFGLAIIPVVGAMGVALDYSLANQSRTQMQAALDNTGLMLAKMMPLTDAQLNTKGWPIFQANMGTTPLVYQQSDLVITQTSSTVDLNVSTSYKTQLASVLKLVGMGTTFAVTTHTVVSWGNSRLRVALVLDNTGSMSSAGKIGALQTATKNLIDQLKTVAVNAGDIYISIVPFARTVNLDPTNYSAAWIDWTAWDAPPPGSTPAANVGPGSNCPYTNSSNGFKCTASPANNANCNTPNGNSGCVGTIPSSGTYSGYICPSYDSGNINPVSGGVYYNGCYNSVQKPSQVVASGSSASCGSTPNCSCSGNGSNKVCTQTFPGQYNHAWIANAHGTWNGCAMDRGAAAAPGTTAGYDQTIDAPAAGATAVPAQQYYYCNITVMGLTDPYTGVTTLKNKVDAMSPNGSTNQPIGLVWGWQSLVGGGPFPAAPAMDTAHFTYNQYIILLSDGLNTQDRWYGDGSTANTSVNDRMYKSGSPATGTCQNIKNSGVKIFAVQVNTGSDPTSTLMQNCASDPSMFFELKTSGAIVTTFQQIGNALANLHLSQ